MPQIPISRSNNKKAARRRLKFDPEKSRTARCRQEFWQHRRGGSWTACPFDRTTGGYRGTASRTRHRNSWRCTRNTYQWRAIRRWCKHNCATIGTSGIGDRNYASRWCNCNASHVLGWGRQHISIIKTRSLRSVLSDRKLCRTSKRQTFSHARTHRVILISRQRHRSQDTDDRHDDHQFDQGKTLLHVACDRTTVHFNTPGWMIRPVCPGHPIVCSMRAKP
jgi:hypothetical protein